MSLTLAMSKNNSKELVSALMPQANLVAEVARQARASHLQLQEFSEFIELNSARSLLQHMNEMSPTLQLLKAHDFLGLKSFQDHFSQSLKLTGYDFPFSASAMQEALESINPAINMLKQSEKNSAFAKSMQILTQSNLDFLKAFENTESFVDQWQSSLKSDIGEKELISVDVLEGSLEVITNQIIASLKNTKSPLEVRLIIYFFNYFVVPILIGIIFYQIQSIESAKESEKIQHSLYRLEESIDKLREQIKEKVFYEVSEAVWLGAGQSLVKDRIIMLVPGQEVEVLDFDGEWVFISAINSADNSIKTGWVPKKYLKYRDEENEDAASSKFIDL